MRVATIAPLAGRSGQSLSGVRAGTAAGTEAAVIRRALLPGVIGALLAVSACSAPQTTIEPRSDLAANIHSIYVIVFWLGLAVFVAILALTLVIGFRYREREGRAPSRVHGNTRLEVLWTLVPVVLVVAILVPTWQVVAESSRPAPDDSLHIDVVGRQWWFEFRYDLDGDGSSDDLVTANELHVPAGRAVSLSLYSGDVIHSFWVPQLAGKVDMVPGHENDLWFTPDADAARAEPYLGQCAEFCGTAHADMRFRVFVDTPEDFAGWVERETGDGAAPAGAEAQAGQELFLKRVWSAAEGPAVLGCATCHTVSGTDARAVVGPNLTHVGSRSTIAAGLLENDLDNLVAWISNPHRIKPGVDSFDDAARFMPAFERVLTPEQIRAIAAYLLELR